MSENKDTGRRDEGVAVEGCSIQVDNYMRGTEVVHASYNPGYTMHFDHGLIPDKLIPATVVVHIGQASLRLTPEVWAAVNDAVQQVLPVDVVPA